MTDTDRGRLDGNQSFDRTIGPLRLLPWTWVRLKAAGNPSHLPDAATAAARFLCAVGHGLGRPAQQRAALKRYEPDAAFAHQVLVAERRYDKW